MKIMRKIYFKCSDCKDYKPVEQFYYLTTNNGYASRCKSCSNKRRSQWQKDHPEKTMENQRKWRLLNPDKEREKKQRYYANHPNRLRAYTNKHYKQNKDKYNAQARLRYAVYTGKIVRPSFCNSCGNKSEYIVGHHSDYKEALKVDWLCRRCHHEVHNGT